jgi:coenzyme F420-0:L-glutamate ligase/coenzyme F420-1:gamma-L-glutamate ligase
VRGVDLATKAIYPKAPDATRWRVTAAELGGPGLAGIRCDGRLELLALPGLPLICAGDDLAALLAEGLRRASVELRDGDVLVVVSKVVSRAEGRFVDLTTVEPSDRARAAALETGKDARLCELILRESQQVSRAGPGALVVRHRLGFVSADAGIDASNAAPVTRDASPISSPSSGHVNPHPPGSRPQTPGPWALLLPADPDGSAERIRRALHERSGAAIGVVISDSFGRPFRLGTVGAAIGVAGLPPLWDRRGEPDLFGRVLQHTVTALADQIAAAADLVAGQAAEGRAAIHVRGVSFPTGEHSAAELYRAPERDLYA